MTPLEPIAKSPGSAAEQAIALTASIAPRAVDVAGFDELVAHAALHPRRDWRLVPAFAIAAMLGALFVLAWPRTAPPRPVELVATSGASWTQRDGVVRLETGRLSVQRVGDAVVRLETPHVSIEATRARFLAEVITGGTQLTVEEGEVVLRAGGVTRVVKAGERVVWPPAPEIPAALLEAAAPTAVRCHELPTDARRACLESESRGDSLDAQAALYELGTLPSLDESLRRFPDGVLHPEVRLRRLVLLVNARRFDDARAAARDFAVSCPDDARLSDVKALEASLR